MPKLKSFHVTRIPGQNGEWIDIHHGQHGTVYLTTTGYVEINQETLLQAIKQFVSERLTSSNRAQTTSRFKKL